MKKSTKKREIYYSDFGVSEASSRAFFHDSLSYGSFVYDFETNQKYWMTAQPKESEITAITVDGKQVLAIDTTFDTRKRFIRLVEVETQKEVAATKVAFGYEALFTPIDGVILVRGDIKKREKVVVLDIKTEEIQYTFPGASPLSYGQLNEELQTFVLPNPRKKAEAFTYNFQTKEANVIALPAKRLIHRVALLAKDTYFYIDGDYIATLFKDGVIVWQTALDFDDSLHYAPDFFIRNNRVYFSCLYDSPVTEQKETRIPCFYTLNLATGKLENIQIPHSDYAGFFLPFLGNQVVNNFGMCIDLDTKKQSKLAPAIFI